MLSLGRFGHSAFPPLLVGIVVPVTVLLIGLYSTAAGVARESARRSAVEDRRGGI